jgi:hypothetical protein
MEGVKKPLLHFSFYGMRNHESEKPSSEFLFFSLLGVGPTDTEPTTRLHFSPGSAMIPVVMYLIVSISD